MVETNVAENFYVDPLLQKACQPVVDVACNHIEPGDGKSVIFSFFFFLLFFEYFLLLVILYAEFVTLEIRIRFVNPSF